MYSDTKDAMVETSAAVGSLEPENDVDRSNPTFVDVVYLIVSPGHAGSLVFVKVDIDGGGGRRRQSRDARRLHREQLPRASLDAEARARLVRGARRERGRGLRPSERDIDRRGDVLRVNGDGIPGAPTVP